MQFTTVVVCAVLVAAVFAHDHDHGHEVNQMPLGALVFVDIHGVAGQ